MEAIRSMEILLNDTWKVHLQEEFQKPYFMELMQFVKNEYEQNVCFPPFEDIFAAFNACDWENLKVIIIGQDPYHGKGQANGLCFSVKNGIPFPPSLINIFKEIHADLGNTIPTDGDLFRWSEQGVLLLNATLTVRESEPGSHQKKGWEVFTDSVIKTISKEKENCVFLLWGGYARGKAKLIDKRKHLVLESGHPSPLSANRGYWFGNKHFSLCNEFIIQNKKGAIRW